MNKLRKIGILAISLLITSILALAGCSDVRINDDIVLFSTDPYDGGFRIISGDFTNISGWQIALVCIGLILVVIAIIAVVKAARKKKRGHTN